MQTSINGYGDVQSQRRAMKERLLSYQQDRVDRAVQNQRLLIADETGMGKTAAALAAVEEAQAFPLVFVTVSSAVPDMLAECRKWLPWRSSAVLERGKPTAEIVILHPEVLVHSRLPLVRLGPKAVIFDESHYYKNGASERGKAARELAGRCDFRILLSATPIQNLRDDLAHQLELLGRSREVIELACARAKMKVPSLDTQGDVMSALRQLPPEAIRWALQRTVMVRGRHTRERTGLLPVKRQQVPCEGSDTAEYQRLEQQFVSYCKDLSVLKPEDKKGRRQGRIKASSMLNGMRAALGAAKVLATQAWAQDLLQKQRRGVVFCYHRAVAEVLSLQLPGRVVTITGATPRSQRQAIVQGMAKADFLVATMDALGHGVNGLQHHASDVAFVELDFTHSKHEQAEGRLRRHGQKGQVNAYYFVAPGTYDEAMLATLRRKWKDARTILDGPARSREVNFAEQMLTSIIAQRPWETGKVDWKAAAKSFKKGSEVVKPGKNGMLHGKVLWSNPSSCRVEWDGGLVTFEVPDALTAAPAA